MFKVSIYGYRLMRLNSMSKLINSSRLVQEPSVLTTALRAIILHLAFIAMFAPSWPRCLANQRASLCDSRGLSRSPRPHEEGKAPSFSLSREDDKH